MLLLLIPLFYLALIVFVIATGWKIFAKAGQPGWACIIPFYSAWIMIKIVDRPGWWFVLFFVPLANVIVSIIMIFDLAKCFGRSTAFGFGLLFLGIIFYPILAFGSDVYTGRATTA